MKAERFVVDTNVLISSVLNSAGTPAKLFDALQHSAAILLFSKQTQAELHLRLLLNKFDKYVSIELRQLFLAQLDAVSEYVFITGAPMGCRDADDDKFLETATLGNAACLITGDNDLLVMHPFQGLSILTPSQAMLHYFPG